MDIVLPDVFYEIHSDNPREGPGSNESTRRAFEMLQNLPKFPHILDIGCGPGMQTLELARMSDGEVIAVDNHQSFLDRLNSSLMEKGISDRVQTVNASMFDLPFSDAEFDLIWSEGAIFIIGISEGLKQWKRLLKHGGIIAFTEMTWLKPDAPAEVHGFLEACCPSMLDIRSTIGLIEENGYKMIGHFTLPESDWWTYYYMPIEKRLGGIREKHRNDPDALALIDQTEEEIDIYRRYSDYYGCVFYLASRCD